MEIKKNIEKKNSAAIMSSAALLGEVAEDLKEEYWEMDKDEIYQATLMFGKQLGSSHTLWSVCFARAYRARVRDEAGDLEDFGFDTLLAQVQSHKFQHLPVHALIVRFVCEKSRL